MRFPLITSIALAGAVGVALCLPALAEKKADLQKDGYKCVRVSVNFIECTKAGSPTYWCDDAGNCQAKPARIRPGDMGLKGGTLEVHPGDSGGTKGAIGVHKVQPRMRSD